MTDLNNGAMEACYSLQRRFLEFHKSNPEVWATAVDMAEQLRKKGRDHYSMSTIIEVIRHHTIHGAADINRDYKINNDFIPVYARLFNHIYGVNFFTVRCSHIDDLDIHEWTRFVLLCMTYSRKWGR